MNGAKAQGWTASEAGNGTFYLYNVGANAYLADGASWGTHAALKSTGMTVKLSLNNGVYTITGTKSNNYFTDNGYVDTGSSTNWIFEPVEGLTNTYKLKTAGGVYAFSAPGLYNVKLGSDPGTSMGYWKLVTAANRDDVSNATNLTPVELTHKINNPRFDDNVTGWNDAPSRGGNASGTNGNVDSWDNFNPCAEHYNKTYNTYQELAGLANGTYAVSVQGFYREGGYAAAATKHTAGTESLNAILYANDQEQPLMSIFEEAGKASGGGTATATGISGAFPNDMAAASYFFSAGLYWNTVYVTVTDGTLRIGIKKTTAEGADWTIFDNFRLQYFGNCTIAEAQNGALIVAYNEAKSNAETLAAKAMEASAKSTLNKAITDNTLDTSSASAEQLTAATTALNNAVAAAQPSADLYANIKTLLDGLKTQDASFDGDTKYNAGTYTAISEVYSEYYSYAIAKLGTAANTDFTAAIVNPGFEFGNTLGWTYIVSQDHGAKSTANDTYRMTNSEGSYLFNIWDAGHPITQTIPGLPNGLYQVSAVVSNSGGAVYLLANDVHEYVKTDDSTIGYEVSTKVAITDGNLTIGAVGSNNDAEMTYVDNGVWWYKADNFRLTYLGNVVPEEDAAAILAEVPTGKMGATEQTALNDAKTAFEENKSSDNYATLRTAIDNANLSITAYTKAKTQLDLIVEELEGTNIYDVSLLTAMQTAYSDGTWSTAEANAITMLNNKGWHADNSIDDILMSYWNEGVQQWGGLHVNTWSTEGDNDETNFKVPFYEYWNDDKVSLPAKTMTATVPGFKANTEYSVSAWVRVRQANSLTKVDNKITLQVGEDEAVDVSTGTQVGSSQFYIGTFTAKGTADADGKLTIKFNVAEGSNISWLSFKNVYATEAEEITMTEATPNVKASDYANVTLNRTFNAGWNGIVLPINTTVDAAKTALGATSIQELSSISYDAENGTTLNFTEAETFEAGKPYFVKVAGNSVAQDFTFSGVSTSDATPQTISKESGTVTYDFTGPYASKDITDTDLYFMAGTTLYHVKNTQNITMKPFRAWLENKPADAASSKLSFVFEGEESTGIRSIENGKAATDNAWYDLQGRRVMKPVKGIYIHNGKKIVK